MYIVCFSAWRLEQQKMRAYLLLSDRLGLPGSWEMNFLALPEVFRAIRNHFGFRVLLTAPTKAKKIT